MTQYYAVSAKQIRPKLDPRFDRTLYVMIKEELDQKPVVEYITLSPFMLGEKFIRLNGKENLDFCYETPCDLIPSNNAMLYLSDLPKKDKPEFERGYLELPLD